MRRVGGPNGIRTRAPASGGFGGHTGAPRSWKPAVSDTASWWN
jgi:hypothetical protein